MNEFLKAAYDEKLLSILPNIWSFYAILDRADGYKRSHDITDKHFVMPKDEEFFNALSKASIEVYSKFYGNKRLTYEFIAAIRYIADYYCTMKIFVEERVDDNGAVVGFLFKSRSDDNLNFTIGESGERSRLTIANLPFNIEGIEKKMEFLVIKKKIIERD
jgi:hypothetical protein